jgi:hypothetical protein
VRRSFPSDEPIKHSLESDQNLIFVLQIDVLPWQRKCFKATPGLLSLPRSSILVLKGFEVRYRLALLLLALAVPAAAQDRGADMRTAFARVQHLKHGINASEWFAQCHAVLKSRNMPGLVVLLHLNPGICRDVCTQKPK